MADEQPKKSENSKTRPTPLIPLPRREKAREYAETALKLAYCDGPPYYYKVAYDEAVEMLKRLNV